MDAERPAVDRANGANELPPLEQVLDHARRDYCERLISSTANIAQAAEIAGYTPRGLRILFKKLGIERPFAFSGAGVLSGPV